MATTVTPVRAPEKQSLGAVLSRLPHARRYAATLSARIEGVPRDNRGKRLLEIGAASGYLTVAFSELDYDSLGVEPDPDALRTAQELANELGSKCRVVEGRAEDIPFADQSFDIIVANSVVEHVIDVDACFREISRVLAPGGLFWFETASSMSPFQNEIRVFPFFGWYPNFLKKRIMWWAAKHRPEWVGHTATPAVHWFSDRIAYKRLRAVGFVKVFDRWAIRRDDEGGRFSRTALKIIRSNPLAKRIANAFIRECAYAALKSR